MRTAAALAAALLVLVAATGCAGHEQGHPDAGPDPTVGSDPVSDPTTVPDTTGDLAVPGGVIRTELTFVDRTRGTVARPPQPASLQRELVTAVRRPSSGDGPWPLVVFGHGFAISSDAYATLLDAIAASGFVVAAPEFPGSSTTRPGRPDEHDLDQEPCDLAVVATEVEAASAGAGELAGTVRPGPVALAGQSDGATAAAFAALSGDPCHPGIAVAPVAAVVAFSANPVPAAAIDAGLAAPPALLAITGSADAVNPASHTRAVFDQWPATAWLLTSRGDGHLAPSTDSPHRSAIDAVVVDFLHGALDPDPTASDRMASDAAAPGLTLDHRD